MSDHSRRKFLKNASIGAAAAGAAVVVPATLSASPAGAAEPEATGPTHAGPFMAWVKDAKSGDIAVLVGEKELVHHDPKLARQLARVAARANKS